MLWGMDKFYDSIHLLVLSRELLRRDYPLELLILGILAHAAPRLLRAGACLSETIEFTGNSILAGCQQSVLFTRGLLWDLIAELTEYIPRCPPHQHVDDLAQPIVANSSFALANALVGAGNIVGRQAKRLKINISTKSTIVPISRATLSAARQLEKKKILVKVKSAADDA